MAYGESGQHDVCKLRSACQKKEITKLQAAEAKLKEALEHAKTHFTIIYEHHTRPRQSRGNTSKRCERAVNEIDQALKDIKDE